MKFGDIEVGQYIKTPEFIYLGRKVESEIFKKTSMDNAKLNVIRLSDGREVSWKNDMDVGEVFNKLDN